MRRRKSRTSSCLYLGCFFFDEPGEQDWTGTFQIVVEATSPEDAVERFYEKLEGLRKAGTLFEKPITIYIEGLIKLSGTYKSGLLVNWLSGVSPPAPHVELTCLNPEQAEENEAEVYGYSPSGKKKKEDGEDIEPFLDFGGEELRKQLEKSKGLPPSEATTTSSTDSARRKAEARAKKEAAARARAAAQAKRQRREIVHSTLEKMGVRKRSGTNPKTDRNK